MPEGHNLKEDVMIIVQSPLLRVMAQQFAPKGVAVDATHGTTACNFLLTTLKVTDKYGQGFPVAWCLSNHKDFMHMCIFFQYVKQNCGTLLPRWFMSLDWYYGWAADPTSVYATH